MLDGENRRKQIVDTLLSATKPVNGTALAKQFQVSRQVIVQDIALLRAENKNIISTNKGYFIFQADSHKDTCKKVICVAHTTDQVLEEFYTIVDLGGNVLDVSVEHDLYGQIQVDLIIHNRADAEEFVKKMKNSKDKPLKILTEDVHYHTIEAGNQETIDKICKKLEEKGFLCQE